jgi:hypothetical protein
MSQSERNRPSVFGGPWTKGSLTALAFLDVATAALVMACWYGASTRATPQQQMPWMNFAAVVAVLAFALQAGWLLAGQRAVARRGQTLRQSASAVVDPPALVAASGGGVATTAELVSGVGMTRFHRPGCAFALGRATRSVTATNIRRQGLRPCPMCKPDGSRGG